MQQAAQPHRDSLRPADGAGWSGWSLSAVAAGFPGMLVGLALPLVLVTLTGQYLPGMAVLRTSGYATPARPVLVVNSLVSLAVACAGGITIAIAADGHREASVITFLVTASGMTFLGLGAAFRGIVIGMVACRVLHGPFARGAASHRSNDSQQRTTPGDNRMRHIDIHKLADGARFNRFHAGILAWCALIIICDGYDLAVAGIALPSIMKEMGVTAQNAGFMVSSALFGMMFGAIFLGTIADRIGRRRAIVICLALFSVFTAAAGMSGDPYVFSVMRFLAGLGIGGVMPNVVAQMTEYAPKRIRATMVTLMFSGYAVGGMVAALLGKGLIADHGWQSVFLAAGVPVLLIPFILRSLPESMPFLVKHGRFDELRRTLARMEPTYRAGPGDRFDAPGAGRAHGAPIGQLFREGRGFSTVMFWIAFFMCLFMVYALSSWLAKLMAGAGYSLGSALTFVLVLNFGAVIGAVGGGWLADRFHIKIVLVAMYALAAVSITLLGYPMPTPLLFIVVGLAGASTIGTQIVTYAYAGQFYPTAVRSTGIGWASGVGRGGAILAPIVIGTLVGMALPLQQNFQAMAIPAIIATLCVALIRHDRSASAPVPAAAVAVEPSEA